MLRPSHCRTPRGMHETCFLDCRYIEPHVSRRARLGDIATAVALGLAGALVLFYGLSS